MINDNTVQINGGGICCWIQSSPTIINCEIMSNKLDGIIGVGGGLYCNNSSPNIENCSINYNVSKENGGGLACENMSNAIFNYCSIISSNFLPR